MNRNDLGADEAAELIRSVPRPTTDELRSARERMVARAEREGLVDVSYRIVDSPFGSMLVAATPDGLVRIAFEHEDHGAVLALLAETVSPRILHSGVRTDDAARELDEYFAGRRRRFDVSVDLRLARGFRRSVLEHLLDVEYGSTTTYSALARASGHPFAVRAVGSACSHNPVPIVVPCHRVVRSDGTLGRYGGGSSMKEALLTMETAS